MSHTRGTVEITRLRGAALLAIAFTAGVAVAGWFVVLVKGGAL